MGAGVARISLAAFLRRALPALDVGTGQALSDRLFGGGGRRALLASLGLLLNRDLVARLFRLGRREQRSGGDIERDQAQTGEQDGAQNLVEFEGIHCGTAPARGDERGVARPAPGPVAAQR